MLTLQTYIVNYLFLPEYHTGIKKLLHPQQPHQTCSSTYSLIQLTSAEHYSDGKESACSVGELGLIPGSGRSPGKGNGNPLQYSCLENSMDRGAWQVTVHAEAKSWTWLSDNHAHTLSEKLCWMLDSGCDQNSMLGKLIVQWWRQINCCCCSLTKLCSTLHEPMDCSTPAFPVLYYLPEFAQVRLHWVGDTV